MTHFLKKGIMLQSQYKKKNVKKIQNCKKPLYLWKIDQRNFKNSLLIKIINNDQNIFFAFLDIFLHGAWLWTNWTAFFEI